VLIAANPVFKSVLFSDIPDVWIGRTEKWVSFRIGPWSVHLAIDSERRFPDVVGCIPAPSAAQTQLKLSEADALFLENAISRLPVDEGCNGAVTVGTSTALSCCVRSHKRARSPSSLF
jgi:hypothetical protein